MPPITPFLWFDDQAEEAAAFYTSIFPNSHIREVMHYGDAGPGKPGSVMLVDFELDGQRFQALNGGPEFTFNESISLYVDCATQDEVDRLWTRLTEGGAESQCGWLKDRYGVSWQIVPVRLIELMRDPDPAKAQRVVAAMLTMRKINVAALEAAYAAA